VSAAATVPIRTVTFGDVDAPAWGAMVLGESAFLAVAAGADGRVLDDFRIAGAGADEDWRIAGDGVELVLSAAAAPAASEAAAAAPEAPTGLVQPCRVSGQITLDGLEHAVDCMGVRRIREAPQPGVYGSVREVSAWFDGEEAVAVLALRPVKEKGHSGDVVSATLIDAGQPLAVAESRLSTTYAEGGAPSRMSLELWIGAEEEEQYPRRFAGETNAPPLRASLGASEISASVLRCHGRGSDGTGVYLIATG
jgi:hypothetical protein